MSLSVWRDGKNSVVIDHRHAPVYITTWFGMGTEKIFRKFFQANRDVVESNVAAQRAFVVISDASDAERPPPAVRSRITEISQDSPDGKPFMVGNYVVLESALVRGAFTAMQWLSRKKWPSVVVASPHDAIDRALADLARAGVSPPEGLSPRSYTRPERPEARNAFAGAQEP
jgi:hypothetical protein